MPGRWRGRVLGLAILVLPLIVSAATARIGPTLVITGPDGDSLARVPLPAGKFTLRYRNSLYGSVAEEHYHVASGGQMRLVALAAEELAVLEEYYAADEPARRSARGWQVAPARDVRLEELVVAATDLGERTLIVEGRAPIELWQLVDDQAPMVRLEARDT